MGGRQAKYCLDRDGVRWVLLEGTISRKTPKDSPTHGKDLPVSQVTGLEKTAVKRLRRSPLALPATYAGVALLVLSAGVAFLQWLVALPLLVLGLAALYWGVKKIPGETQTLDAYRIVAPGEDPDEWLIVGAHTEAQGFIEGIRLELKENQPEKGSDE